MFFRVQQAHRSCRYKAALEPQPNIFLKASTAAEVHFGAEKRQNFSSVKKPTARQSPGMKSLQQPRNTHTHTHSSVRCDHMQYRTIEPSRSHKDPALCFHRGKKRGILLKTKPIARIGNDRAVNRHIFKRGLQKSFAIPDT